MWSSIEQQCQPETHNRNLNKTEMIAKFKGLCIYAACLYNPHFKSTWGFLLKIWATLSTPTMKTSKSLSDWPNRFVHTCDSLLPLLFSIYRYLKWEGISYPSDILQGGIQIGAGFLSEHSLQELVGVFTELDVLLLLVLQHRLFHEHCQKNSCKLIDEDLDVVQVGPCVPAGTKRLCEVRYTVVQVWIYKTSNV